MHSSTHLALGRTVLQLFDAQVKKRGEAIALRHKGDGGWSTTSWRAWDEEARAVAAALVAKGVGSGDRVAMPMRTCRASLVALVGVWRCGAVPVPIYPTLADDQIDFIVRDAGARVTLKEEDVEPLAREGRGRMAQDAEAVELRAREVTATDAVALLYTSGTTGEPKGVELSHAAFVFEVDAVTELFGIGPSDEQLLFLPIAHIFGQILLLAAMRVGAATTLASSMLHVLDEAEETRPTYFGSVPRVFEKVHQNVRTKIKEAGRAQEVIFDWAMDVGKKRAALLRAGRDVPLSLDVQFRYAHKLVFSKLHARFGGRLRFAISGAAPLEAWLAEWFHALGIPVYEGYGLTETTAATNVNHPQGLRLGSVGRPVPGVEVKIADGADEGEILVRGPNLMTRYWKRDAETAEAIDAEGWFRTGDIGRIDDDGFLRITDRKKDLLVTAGGKNVAPQRLEAILQRSPLVQRAVVLGDRRPYVVALIVPDLQAIRGLGDVRVHLQKVVDEANAQLAPFETIKRFAVLERDLTVEDGELTPTLKLRRRRIEQRHAPTVDALYT